MAKAIFMEAIICREMNGKDIGFGSRNGAPTWFPPVLSCYVLEIMLASLFSMVASKSPFSRCPGCFLMFFLSHHHDRPFKRTDLFSDLAFEVTLNRSKITCRRARSDGRK